MAKFILSANSPNNYPQHNLSEFCLVGASNAGKSSLINALAKEKIANTSKKPGKTRMSNFYDFGRFYLVDMPGYGYANVSKEIRNSLIKTLENYFGDRDVILGVCQVCSVHGLSERDLEVMDYLTSRFDNYLLLVNKMDKISKSQQIRLKDNIIRTTNLPEEKILFVSAKLNINLNVLMSRLINWI